jgi:hypothetical protein
MDGLTWSQIAGCVCFGTVIGWVLRYVLVFSKEVTIASMSSIVSAVGGGAITALFDAKGEMFSFYSIGLALGYFTHVLLLDVDASGKIVYRWGNTSAATTTTTTPKA